MQIGLSSLLKIKSKDQADLNAPEIVASVFILFVSFIFFMLFVTSSYYDSRSLLLFMKRKNTYLCRLFELDNAGLAKHFEYFRAYSECEFQDS